MKVRNVKQVMFGGGNSGKQRVNEEGKRGEYG
jgi:hypothetical protein